jgi:hypothetical protein
VEILKGIISSDDIIGSLLRHSYVFKSLPIINILKYLWVKYQCLGLVLNMPPKTKGMG